MTDTPSSVSPTSAPPNYGAMIESDKNPSPEKIEQWMRMVSMAAIGSVSLTDQPLWNDLSRYLYWHAAPRAKETNHG